MRVLAVVPLYPPKSLVGAWISTHECLRHMVTRGHKVDVVTYLANEETYFLDGVRVFGRRWDIDDRARRSDLMISHLGENHPSTAVAARAGVPIVRMAHGHNNAGNHDGSTLIVFNSAALRDQVRWDGPSIVIPPPVRADDYRTSPGDSITLVNLAEDKGGRLFWQLALDLTSLPFLGILGGYGRQIVRSAPNVKIVAPTGNIRGDVYGRTRILLMPSAHESFGRVGVEAMCSGIPVIAHPTAGLRESLGDAGTFVHRTDVDGWKAAIGRLQDPDEWSTASQAALARSARLDPDSDLDRFADTLEGLVKVPA